MTSIESSAGAGRWERDSGSETRLNALWEIYRQVRPPADPLVRHFIDDRIDPPRPLAESLQRLAEATEFDDPAHVAEAVVALRWLNDRGPAQFLPAADRERADTLKRFVGERIEAHGSAVWDPDVLGPPPDNPVKWTVQLINATATQTPDYETTAPVGIKITRTGALAGAGSAFEQARPKLAERLDPQGWDRMSDAFNLTRRVPVDGAGRPEYDNRGAPVLQPVTNLGESWSGMAYEDVSVGLVVGRFQNVLATNFVRDSVRIRVDYAIYDSVASRVAPEGQATPGGIDIDYGYLQVAPGWNDNTILVEGTKNVRFIDRTPGDDSPQGPFDYGLLMSYLAPTMLEVWYTLLAYSAAWTGLPT